MLPSLPPKIPSPLSPLAFPRGGFAPLSARQTSSQATPPKNQAQTSKLHPIWMPPIVINGDDGTSTFSQDMLTAFLPSPPLPPVALPPKPPQQVFPASKPALPISKRTEKPVASEVVTALPEATAKPPAEKRLQQVTASSLASISNTLEKLVTLQASQNTKGQTGLSTWSNQKLLGLGAFAIATVSLPVWLLSRTVKQVAQHVAPDWSKGFKEAQEAQQTRLDKFNDMSTKLIDPKQLDVQLEDVQGIEGAKSEIRDIIRFLRNGQNYTGAKFPKGILLEGPPGNGKTYLAKAMAKEAGVPFFHLTGSDFMESFVGVGAARVRNLFKAARAQGKCVIFIDEIDSIGKKRGGLSRDNGSSEHEGTLGQLLSEMDGLVKNKGIFMIGATNRADVLDPALVRPGRFDKTFTVQPPWTEEQRLTVLQAHVRKHYANTLGADADLRYIAEITEGASCAELANLVDEAARLANRRISLAKEQGQSLAPADYKISQMDLIDAFENVTGGLVEPTSQYSERYLQMVAVHEGLGHAWIAYLLDRPIYMISTQPRSTGSQGHVHSGRRRNSDKLLKDKEYYLQNVLSLMAGTAAEEALFGKKHVSNGATSDLEKANTILRDMMSKLGFFNKQLGFLVNTPDPHTGEAVYTDTEKQKIADLSRKILDNAYQRVLWVIRQIPPEDQQRLIKALSAERTLKGPEATAQLFEASIQATQNKAWLKQLRAVLEEFLTEPTTEFRPSAP